MHNPQLSDHDDKVYTKATGMELTCSPDWGHSNPGVPGEEMGYPVAT